MKNVVLSIGLIAVMLCCGASCSSTQKAAEKGQDAASQIDETAMKEKGFTSGVIVYSDKEGDCAYTISADNGATYDPINLEDEYKSDGMKVWFTFRGLRMMNRCAKANPIDIEEIKKG